jgi:hypothetical protein
VARSWVRTIDDGLSLHRQRELKSSATGLCPNFVRFESKPCFTQRINLVTSAFTKRSILCFPAFQTGHTGSILGTRSHWDEPQWLGKLRPFISKGSSKHRFNHLPSSTVTSEVTSAEELLGSESRRICPPAQFIWTLKERRASGASECHQFCCEQRTDNSTRVEDDCKSNGYRPFEECTGSRFLRSMPSPGANHSARNGAAGRKLSILLSECQI